MQSRAGIAHTAKTAEKDNKKGEWDTLLAFVQPGRLHRQCAIYATP